MPPIEPSKHSSAVQTPKPRSIAAANGATTTPPVILAEESEDDLLSINSPPKE